VPNDDDLFQRLRQAPRPDLLLLLGDLKIASKGLEHKSKTELIHLVSKELRSAAGSSLLNPLRGQHDLPYRRILVDVADKLSPGKFTWGPFEASGSESSTEIEDYIAERLEARLADLIASMSDDDKRKLQARLQADMRAKGVPEAVVGGTTTALSSGLLSGAALGPLIASLLFGSLWTTLFGMSVAQLVLGGVAVGGPVGIAVAAVAVATSPSYSKTIPAVYRLILIRRSAEARKGL
jgi:uncharacterized protein YaaW (UPF0174 family)